MSRKTMISAAVLVATLAFSTSAFAECRSVPVLVDNNTNVRTEVCAIPTMNGGVFLDVSMSSDCLPLSISPSNPAEHIENRNREVDPITGVVDQSKSC